MRGRSQTIILWDFLLRWSTSHLVTHCKTVQQHPTASTCNSSTPRSKYFKTCRMEAAFLIAPAHRVCLTRTSTWSQSPLHKSVCQRARSMRARPRMSQPGVSEEQVQAGGRRSGDGLEEGGKEEEDGGNVIQGPTQAPTKVGVSTAGLEGADGDLIKASYNAEVSGIEKALADGADVNTTDVNGRTSLHFCAGNGLQLLVKQLVERGANPNKQDVLGLTPLHMATGYKMVTTVTALVELGADANVADNDGRLAVEIAEDFLDKTPKKKFFMDNADYGKLEEIVRVLDDATEVEDGEEGEAVDGGAVFDGASADLGVGGERVEEVGDTKFVVRVKAKEESGATDVVKTDSDDVKVTIRIKEPDGNK